MVSWREHRRLPAVFPQPRPFQPDLGPERRSRRTTRGKEGEGEKKKGICCSKARRASWETKRFHVRNRLEPEERDNRERERERFLLTLVVVAGLGVGGVGGVGLVALVLLSSFSNCKVTLWDCRWRSQGATGVATLPPSHHPRSLVLCTEHCCYELGEQADRQAGKEGSTDCTPDWQRRV